MIQALLFPQPHSSPWRGRCRLTLRLSLLGQMHARETIFLSIEVYVHAIPSTTSSSTLSLSGHLLTPATSHKHIGIHLSADLSGKTHTSEYIQRLRLCLRYFVYYDQFTINHHQDFSVSTPAVFGLYWNTLPLFCLVYLKLALISSVFVVFPQLNESLYKPSQP